MTRAFAVVAVFTLLILPDVAFACPVCFSGNEANRIAYYVSFLMMTTLPLALIGSFVYYLVRRAKELSAADELARDTSRAPRVPEPPPTRA